MILLNTEVFSQSLYIIDMHLIHLFSVCCILSLHLAYAIESTTELVLFVFRHGDRSPYTVYPGYEHQNYWESGLGQLTTVGMRQQHALGEFIKQTYTPHLISSSYRRDQIYVRSTSFDRTIMSALCQLSGIFPPSVDDRFNSELIWQPIPVHENADELLRVRNCPRYQKLLAEYPSTKEYVEMSIRHAKLLKLISVATNTDVNLSNIVPFIDTSICDEQHNLSLPSWAKNNYKTLLGILDWSWKKSQDTREKVILSGGRFMSEFWARIDDKINGVTPTMKVYFYSAHDSTLVTVTNSFNIWNQLHPPYATILIAELIREETDWFIQFSYRNSSDSLPYPLKVPECGHKCPVEKLRQLTADVVLSQGEWETKCGMDSVPVASKQHFIILVVLEVFFVALILIAIFFTALLVYRRKYTPVSARYSKFIIDDSEETDDI